MRNEILQLKDLGRMPNESINDSDSKLWCWYKSSLKMLFMICSGAY